MGKALGSSRNTASSSGVISAITVVKGTSSVPANIKGSMLPVGIVASLIASNFGKDSENLAQMRFDVKMPLNKQRCRFVFVH